MLTAAELSRRTGADVSDHPYDLGYWSRVARLPRPPARKAREGWDDADRELRRESQDPEPAKTQPCSP